MGPEFGPWAVSKGAKIFHFSQNIIASPNSDVHLTQFPVHLFKEHSRQSVRNMKYIHEKLLCQSRKTWPHHVFLRRPKKWSNTPSPCTELIICIYNISCTVFSKIIFFLSAQESPSFYLWLTKVWKEPRDGLQIYILLETSPVPSGSVQITKSCQELGGCARKGVTGAYLPQHMLLTTARLGFLALCSILSPS